MYLCPTWKQWNNYYGTNYDSSIDYDTSDDRWWWRGRRLEDE